MSWISNLTRPTVKKIGVSKDIPDNFWDRCPKCGAMLFHSEMTKSHFVCQHCDYHFRLPVKERLELLFDKGEYNLIQLPKVNEDPLHFHDIKKYSDRLKDAKKKTNQEDAIVVAHGFIGQKRAVVGIFNFDFMGGSMGMAVGQAIVTAAKLAELQKAALILIPASGGARMQEGILSLMQMARTTIAVKELNKKKIPYIAVLTNPTTGGVTASFAMLADITLAEPGAIIGFAGSRVIEQTIHETLPPNFQKSEYLLEHGMIDQVVSRKNLREKLIQILSFFDL
jgi:acetyl-CoA carboxylase carboxyl transferase subunit beta